MRAPLCALLLTAVTAFGATPVEEAIARGDAYDAKFQANPALEAYLAAEKIEPDNAQLLAKIARQYRHLMADTSDTKEKLRLGRTSLDYAKRAAAAGPNDSEAQLSPAISLGKMMPLLPQKEQVAASPRVKASADAALAANPRNDLAWHILGRWNRVLAEVSGFKRAVAGVIYGSLPSGSYAEAERALRKAVALNPRRLMHHIELGRILADQGKNDEAKKSINRGLSMPNTEKDDADMKALGREALRKID